MKVDLQSVREFFAASPFMVDLGIEPVAVGEGTLSAAMPLLRRFHQHTGQVHAGVSATLADHTMGAAAQTLAPDGFLAITAELKTSLLRPAIGDRLLCEARVVKAGRALSFTEAQVFAESAGHRTLVATASATMALVATR
ncbi:MAG: PaaI family thioesterase [Rubrivivax sp.]